MNTIEELATLQELAGELAGKLAGHMREANRAGVGLRTFAAEHENLIRLKFVAEDSFARKGAALKRAWSHNEPLRQFDERLCLRAEKEHPGLEDWAAARLILGENPELLRAREHLTVEEGGSLAVDRLEEIEKQINEKVSQKRRDQPTLSAKWALLEVARENPSLIQEKERLYRQDAADGVGQKIGVRNPQGQLEWIDAQFEDLIRQKMQSNPELNYKMALRLVASENVELVRRREDLFYN
jgi:hypothetical protein